MNIVRSAHERCTLSGGVRQIVKQYTGQLLLIDEMEQRSCGKDNIVQTLDGTVLGKIKVFHMPCCLLFVIRQQS